MPRTPPGGTGTRRRRLFAVLPLAAVATGLLAAQIAWVGPAAVASSLGGADPLRLALALLVILTGALLSAANAWWMAGRDEGIDLRAFLPHYWTGWAVGLLLPGQVGDTLTLSLLLRQHRVPLQRSLGGLGIDKLVSLLVSLAAVCALPLVYATGSNSVIALTLLGACLLALAVLAALDRRIAALAARLPHAALRGAAGALAHAASLLRHRPLRVAGNLVLSLLKLALTGSAYALALAAVGAEVPLAAWASITLCATAAGLIAYLPISLNGIGTVELTGLALFGALGFAPAAVLSAYLCLRLLTLLAALAPLAMLLLRSPGANSGGR